MRVWGPMDWNFERNLLAMAAADREESVVEWRSRAPELRAKEDVSWVSGRIVAD